jgi:hypothetical protein
VQRTHVLELRISLFRDFTRRYRDDPERTTWSSLSSERRAGPAHGLLASMVERTTR